MHPDNTRKCTTATACFARVLEDNSFTADRAQMDELVDACFAQGRFQLGRAAAAGDQQHRHPEGLGHGRHAPADGPGLGQGFGCGGAAASSS